MKYLSKYTSLVLLFLLFIPQSNAFANDDTTTFVIRAWKYDLDQASKYPAELDTIVHKVHVYNPLMNYGKSFLYLGNLGSAGVSNDFSHRGREGFVFGHGYTPYLFDKASYQVYRAKKPFTLVQFVIGDNKDNQEQVIDVLHTQNVNKDLNAGLKVKSINSIGQYPAQKVQITNLGLFGHFNNERANIHLAVNRNMLRNLENGGVIDSVFQRERTGLESFIRYPENTGAKSTHRNRNFQVLTEYTFSRETKNDTLEKSVWQPGFVIGQRIGYDDNYRVFSASNFDSTLFNYYYIHPSQTNDSAYYRIWEHDLYLTFKSGKQSLSAGMGNEFQRFANMTIPDTAFMNSQDGLVTVFEHNHITLSEKKGFYNMSLWSKLNINVSDVLGIHLGLKYFVLGYQQNMLDLNGKLRLNSPYFILEGHSRFHSYKPAYFYNQYTSNYFIWDNDFDNSKEWSTHVTLKDKHGIFGINAGYSLLNNLVYFNNLAKPEQYNQTGLVMSAKVFGEFKLGPVVTVNELLFQKSNMDNIMPLPGFCIYHSASLNQKLFNRVMHLSLGYDVYYYSQYYAYAYMPVTGIFFNQNTAHTGNYPFVDIFANFMVKKTLFFFKYEHLTEGVFGKKYYTALHYPNPGRVLRFGITWMFIN